MSKTVRWREQLLLVDPHCALCGEELTRKTATLDHIVPRGRGGPHKRYNVQLACKPCNSLKGSCLIDRW